MVQQVELSTQMLLRPFFEFLDFVAMLFMGCFDCKPDGPHSSYEDPTALAAGTSFTASEVEALRKLFRKLSSSVIDDGLIHKEELQLALFRNSSRENLFVDRVFDLFDAKHNGVIDFEEFVQSLSIFHPRAPQEEKVEFAFNLYDLRHTGFIEREEVEQMIIALLSESDLPLSDDVIAAILDKTFSEADTNKDGRIDSGEWHAFVARNPSLLKHMTLPYLNDLTIEFPSFNLNAETDDDL